MTISIEKLTRLVPNAFWILGLAAPASVVAAQDSITLHMGDQAPPLKYSKWLKGTPVDITGDKVYVIECWATWCGPCIAAMPHLSQLAKEYEGKAVFIGCDVWEQSHSKNPDQPYENFLPQVERFVNSSANRMSYNVIADDNAQDMANNWLKAAGRQGIPCTFVVKNNRIMWIGHPIKLDSIIGPVLDGSFDVAAHRKTDEASSAASRAMIRQFTEATKEVKDAVAAKDYDKAFRLIDDYIVKVPMTFYVLKTEKFNILLDHFSEAESLKYAQGLSIGNEADKEVATEIAFIICDKDGYSSAAYRYAADQMNRTTPMNCLLLDKVAEAQSKAGDVKEAVATEQKAVELAKTESKDSTFGGRVFDYTVTDFEVKVKEYKDKLKSGASVATQNTVVTGNIKGLKEKLIHMTYVEGKTPHQDSVKVVNGKFTWKLQLAEPQEVYLMFPRMYYSFFAEPGHIHVTGIADSSASFTVTGSKSQDEAEAFDKSLKDLTDQEDPLYRKYGHVSKEEQVALEMKLDEIKNQIHQRGEEYIVAHPASFYSIHLVVSRAGYGTDYAVVKKLYDELAESAKGTGAGKALSDRLEILKRSAIGSQMINFSQADTTGADVQFSAFKGKYVLVDFWASWCGPCRGENPNVLKAYNKYKDKDFTVVGVSLDDKGDKWKKAIREDNMPWAELSDLKGWKNEVSDYFGIQGIPSNLLVDPSGKIVARDLRGEALDQKLSELLK